MAGFVHCRKLLGGKIVDMYPSSTPQSQGVLALVSTTHETLERHEEVKGSTNRSFGLLFVFVFVLVAVWPWIFGTGSVRVWSASIAGLLTVITLFVPAVLTQFNRLWIKFGLLLHRVVNPLTMGMIFFLTVTPTALIFRILGKDPLRLKLNPNAESYWIHRNPPGPNPDSMTQQF